MPLFRTRAERAEAALRRHERQSLESLLASYAKADPFFRDVRDLVFARGGRERAAVCARNPELRSGRGESALEILISFATMSGLVASLPVLQEVQAWLREPQSPPNQPVGASALGPASGPHEIVDHFVGAAIGADKRFLRTQDPREIRSGIDIWEQLVASGKLSQLPPESLIQAYVIVGMLYARRHEVDHHSEDLDLAFRYLHEARRHVIPGSSEDLSARMSAAAWLMLRYETGKDPQDLDQAITGWMEVRDVSPMEAVDRAVAAANLGRALLLRYRTTGSRDDERLGSEMLHTAVRELPRDHPARPIVQQQLAYASLRSTVDP